MNVYHNIMKDIVFHSYTTPIPIQAQGLLVALFGHDLLGCIETRFVKTVAFALPLIQHSLAQLLVRWGDGPSALVLVPTRERAQQIEKEVKAFSKSMESFKTTIVIGGTNIYDQRSKLKGRVEVVVATLSQFIDHLQQGNNSISRVLYVVLDGVDRKSNMGFEP